MRTRPALAALALLCLTACGGVRALDAEQLQRLERDGVDLALVYLVDLPGYALAEQSLGVVGDDGFGASYTHTSDAHAAHLRVERAPYDDASCTADLFHAPPGAPVTCEREGGGWYRASGDRHEYVVLSGDTRLSLNAPLADPDRAVLQRVLLEAQDRFGSHVRLGTPPPVRLIDPAPATTAPAAPPRGDLPETGDGAPVHPGGPGGPGGWTGG